MKCSVVNINTMDEIFRFRAAWLPRIGEIINPTGEIERELKAAKKPTRWVVVEVHHTVCADAPAEAHGVHLYCEEV